MKDLIEKQVAIDIVRKCHVKEVTPAYMLIDKAEVMTELMMLPSAQPMSGKWIVTSKFEDCCYVKCNQCNVTQVFYHNKLLTNFCPNCGADMRKENR